MKTSSRLLLGMTFSVLLPAAAVAQVAYDYNRNYDFRNLKTFAFKEAPTDETTTQKTTTYDSPFVAQRVQEAVSSQLRARGLREDNAHPDAYVTTRSAFRTEMVYYGGGWGPYGWGWNYGWGWGYGGPVYADEIIKGSLIVDLVDARTGGLIWRGIKESTMHEHKDPEDRSEKVQEVVAKIFKKFPNEAIVATSGYVVPKPADRDR